MRKYFFLLSLACLFLAQTAFAAYLDISGGFVKPMALKQALGDEHLVIVDVSLSPTDYTKEHIPGAVFVHWIYDLADPGEKKYYRVAPKDRFEEVMGRLGVTNRSTLVFYDNRENRLAIRALWVAAFYGHDKAAILEGGISAWKAAGLEVTGDVSPVRPTKYSARTVRDWMSVDKEFVRRHLRNNNVLFIDARPEKMYTGEAPGKIINTGEEVARRGHLPGALNIPWKTNIDDTASFVDENTLLWNYGNKGLSRDVDVIFYCNEGVHAVYNWFVVSKILGMGNARVYEGSMGEWADDALLPMVSGIGF